MARRRSGYSDDFYYRPSRPLEAPDGIKARNQRGAFAQNWWATRWIQALEHLLDAGRLSRGRSYARRGQVLSIEEKKDGHIDARVQGSRAQPYKISVRLTPLSDVQWEQVIEALAEQALFTAQLLAGEMPQNIESAFQAAGVSLFPTSGKELTTHCSCPDWANPCKHVAAVHLILGERFDEDPFLLFRLRGRTQEQILQGLRLRRAGQPEDEDGSSADPEVILALEECLGNFWGSGGALDPFSVQMRAPQIDMPILKRLGEPAFMPEEGLFATLEPVYRAISRNALMSAYQSDKS